MNTLGLKTVSRKLCIEIFAFAFLFFVFVSWCTPMSSDDLVFATIEADGVSDYLRFVVEYGNGRLLGNCLTVVLNMFPSVAGIVKSAILASCCVLLPGILKATKLWEYLCILILFICLDPALFGETFAWNSGFSNYIPPIWITMIIVFLLQKYSQYNEWKRFLCCCVIGVLSLCGQLFVEHTSGVNLLLSLCILIASCHKYSKEWKPCFLWLLGTVVGLTIMLVLPKVFYIPDNYADNYRSINLGSISDMIISAAKNVIKLVGAYFGPCTVTICAGASASVWLSRKQRSQKLNSIFMCICLVSTVYLIVNLLLASSHYMGKSAVIQHLFDMMFLILPFGVWIIASWQMERGSFRSQQLFCLAFAMVSLAPLLIVSTVPNRVILQSYMFIISAAILCVRPVLSVVNEKLLNHTLILLTVVSMFVVGNIFFSINNMCQHREDYIRQEIAAGSTEIEIFYVPYDYGSWDHIWIATYYGAEYNNVKFVNIGFDSWMGTYYK